MSAAPDTSAASLALPYRFGDSYVLFDRIGVGGMAEIYLAQGTTRVGVTRLAVVKLVLPNLAGDARFAAMLTAEAKLAAQLSHANIVQTYDLGREQGRLYIAMEYVEGFDLNELLRRCARARVPLPAEFALFVVGETLRALDYAHRRKGPDGKLLGLVHRDVSPSNVLISFEGEVKLCDFGIARALGGAAEVATEAVEGKAAYMAPEHARGELIDGRADVFGASIVLWELLAGKRLYRAAPGQDLLALARAAAVPPLPDRGLPDHARLAAIVARGLARDPAERFPTALAMARELDAYAMGVKLHASPLKLGEFIMANFGQQIVELRRARERASGVLAEELPAPPPPVVARDSQPSAVRPRAAEPAAVAPPAPAVSPPVEPLAAPPALVAPSVAEVPAPAVPAVTVAAPARGNSRAGRVAGVLVALTAVAAAAGWLLAHHR